MYLRHLRHEIKQIKSNVFYLCFLFKSIPPPFPTHRVPFAHPTCIQNKNKNRSQFTVQLVPVNILRHYPSPLQRRSYLCSFSCRCRESILYVLNAQKEHTRAFFVWTAWIWESIPILERVGVMSQFPHLYIFVLPPTLMWMGFSMNSPILGGSADVVASTSISSSLVSNLVGVGVGVVVEVGVVAVLTYLSSCGNSPAPTSLHVCSNAAHPSATNW